MSAINSGIKNIKISNVTSHFKTLLDGNLEEYISFQIKKFDLERLNAALTSSTSILLNSVSFVIYSLMGNSVDPALIFPAYIYLDSIAAQLVALSPLIGQWMTSQEGYIIISDFLLSEESTEISQSHQYTDLAIKLDNVTWKWYDAEYLKKIHKEQLDMKRHGKKGNVEHIENQNTFELKNLNIEIQKGSLVGIVGSVGSGKSTLFSGLVNELLPIEGEVVIQGKVAYATQQPWIMMESILENITFGKDYEKEKLLDCVKASGLVRDFNSFEEGMFTQIGENGINLSGGQKARVSLARCLYSNADIYLLDDPLAALDAHVGKQLFEQVVKKRLAGKTVLLATHQLQYMQQVDKILVLDQGQVLEFGTFEELINKGGTFAEMMASYQYDPQEPLEESSVEELQITENPEKTLDIIKNEKKHTVKKYGLNVLWYHGGVRNYKFYFEKMTASVLNTPLHFFEENPVGRIINRFSGDLSGLDGQISLELLILTTSVLSFIGKFVLIVAAGGVAFVQKAFDLASLEFKRLFLLKKTPMIAFTSESLAGLLTISLFNAQQYFKRKYFGKNDDYISLFYLYETNISWFQVRVAVINALVNVGIVVASLVFNQHSTIFSALVALALTQSESCAKDVILLINCIAYNKANMNCFERVVEYCEDIDQEAPKDTLIDEKVGEWPSHGEISVKGLEIAYHSKPDVNVIHSLGIDIKAGERVGVVGRTGSGKSTFGTAFFRLIEPKNGNILIDGVDIKTLGLNKLRGNIQMIAQEANLFSGTVRFNLTLGQDISDEALWLALDMVGLKTQFSQLPEKLEYKLQANGSNLSFGEGQLLCLARVIVKKPKLLILDEASSAVDSEADQTIQKVLQEHLPDTTIISIAHRLNTIADYDKVMVLEQGTLVEFDSPYNLLQNPKSAFSKLVDASGKNNSILIRDLAKQ
ncbi:Multidrug resistance-associated protein 9 [Boothiomyces macroporosus]|uniref:Multidrug resistance-associated protein 9 n=1 Tax=Boothiomyces macroporosus TaxID=261099 RepID=A0AAD5UGY5_9FUNG|nr:Multidrug resistance-associated protein 9 [Boothiomyces macroporosus]